jgi:hypothetical protein
MTLRNRRRTPPTEAWRRLEFLVETPGQGSYEGIRPVLLFGAPVAERATITQTPPRTIYRCVVRFKATRLGGLQPSRVEHHQRLPAELRQAIVDLKQEHPPLHFREISTI